MSRGFNMDNGNTSTTTNSFKPTADLNKRQQVLEWLNDSHSDDDSESVLSYTTAASSLVESEDDLDFTSLKISNNSGSKRRSSEIIVLHHIPVKESLIQTIGNINIDNSSDIYIGNKYLVHGHNDNNETNATNKPLVSLDNEEQIKIPKGLETKQEPRVFPGILRIIDRKVWIAQRPMDPYHYINNPVKLVIISHSETGSATTQADNILLVRHLQNSHVESNRWNDISYNFMIGSDGNVYQGRGWGVVGAHTKGYNTISVGISFIGTFMRELPPVASLNACKLIIQKGVKSGNIAPDYKLVGHCQCSPTQSPGRRLFEEIQTWEHYFPEFNPEELLS